MATMGAPQPDTPVLDRVEEFMRGSVGPVEQGDIVTHFAETASAAMVRLCLGDLRKRDKLDHTVDGGKVFYIWAGEKRAPGAPALRHESQIKRAHRQVATYDEKIVLAMQDLSETTYRVDDIWRAVGGSKKQIKAALSRLHTAGKIHGSGSTRDRRYSLKPIEEEPKVREGDRLPPPIGTAAATRLRRQRHANPALEAPLRDEPTDQTAPDEPAPSATDVEKIMTAAGQTPIAALTADGRLLVVNGGRGTMFDREITRAVLELVRTFDGAGLMQETA